MESTHQVTSISPSTIDPFMNELFGDTIEHYGTKEHSGRYKFGSGDRPYQRLEGSKAGRKAEKAYNKEIKKMNKQQQKQEAKQKKQEESERRQTESKEAAEKKKREKILRDSVELKKHQYDYSPEEVEQALKRFNWDQQLHEINQKKLRRGADYLQTIIKYMSSGTTAYNLSANAYNAFNKDKKDLPIINVGSGNNDNKPKKKKPDTA